MLDKMTLELLSGSPSHSPDFHGRWLAAVRTGARPCPPMLHPQVTRTSVITGAQARPPALDGIGQFLARRGYHARLRQGAAQAITATGQTIPGFIAHHGAVTTTQPHLVHALQDDDNRVVVSVREDGAGRYIATAILVGPAASAIATVAIVESGRSPCARCALEALRVGLTLERDVPVQALPLLDRPATHPRVQDERLIRHAEPGIDAALLAYLPDPGAPRVARALQQVIPRALSRRSAAAMAPPPGFGAQRGGAPRAWVIATGPELLLTGDRNGPYLSRSVREMGLQPGGSAIVPDVETEIIRLLTTYTQAGARLIITTGGTGATDDDTTPRAVARFARRPRLHDSDLEQVVLAQERQERRGRTGWNEQAMFEAARRQSHVPQGAIWLRPVGTAPGFVLIARRPGFPVVVVLPGPPAEMQAMWAQAVETEPVRALLAEAGRYEVEQLRLLGQEADLQRSIDVILSEDPEVARLEIGTFWEGGEELRVDAWFDPADRDVFDRFAAALRDRVGERLYSPDGRTIEEIVAALLGERTIAAVESGTPGGTRSLLRSAKADVTGGVKLSAAHPLVLLGPGGTPGDAVPPSAELARAHARSARGLLGCDIGVGVAGPGRVPTDPTHIYVCVDDGERRTERTLTYPPDERAIAEYARAVLHVVRAHLLETA